MIFFGHLGITLGVVRAAEKLFHACGWQQFAKNLSYRSVTVGSVLPDLIDKPTGRIILHETLNNGRIFCHTLLFVLLLTLTGLKIKKHRRILLSLSLGSFLHLLLDQMWRVPETLFWPLMGLRFPVENTEGWLWLTLRTLCEEPALFIPEMIGLALLVILGPRLLGPKTEHGNNPEPSCKDH